ncbi:hypothetical protein OHA18_23115 [Kribbella sp. NBC_00709]|uniref:hypothetical protein n=1 Tax=Kribbella sp. NBC_00709 TaxID=2975972 RepID=UPI002E2BC769|nr:hypothetical protein [Kribbella sp. NBC_00709]
MPQAEIDRTEFEPGHRLVIEVRAWPAGAGRVEFVATARPDGCLLVMREQAVEGPANLLPRATVDRILQWRSTETLRRLAYLAELRAELHETHPAGAAYPTDGASTPSN